MEVRLVCRAILIDCDQVKQREIYFSHRPTAQEILDALSYREEDRRVRARYWRFLHGRKRGMFPLGVTPKLESLRLELEIVTVFVTAD